MSDLVAIAFPSEAKAGEVRQNLMSIQKEYLELDDAVIAVKDSQGHIKLNQLRTWPPKVRFRVPSGHARWPDFPDAAS